jgi:hypothetical protein
MYNKNSSVNSTTDFNIKQEINKIDASPENSTSVTHTIDKKITYQRQEENYHKNKSYTIFEEIDIDSVRLELEPIAGVKPLAAFRMKQNTIKEIALGDTILLPSIDGNSYELTITHKEVSPRGNVSIDGSFTEDGIHYSAILTEGSHAAFISMHTPEGTFEIELLNGIGYVYKSNDINQAKIDYGKSDEVINHQKGLKAF